MAGEVEFSPSKAGPAGLVKLIAALDHVLLLFDIDKVLADARVSRIDAAIDLIGANPIDLIAHIKKPGKRLVYVGAQGHPETFYLYERRKPLKNPPSSWSVKTTGPLRLKLYERRDYHRQLKLPPPYGPSPVTRAEVEMRWTKSRPLFSDLFSLKNGHARGVSGAVEACAMVANDITLYRPKSSTTNSR